MAIMAGFLDKQTKERLRMADQLGKSRPALSVIDTLTIETRDGARTVELLYGDITKLAREDKVDLVMVSAFQGDYIPTSMSLIGALLRNLGLSVANLATEKQEDLRQIFHCWISKPLPDHLPYKQLLCFETPFNQSFRHPAELVADVFRALVPHFSNEEKTVITPILSTGNQGFGKSRMIRAMLEAAVNWIRAGLPLKCFKIVIYGSLGSIMGEDKDVLRIFREMKQKYEKIDLVTESREISYDIYLSYHQEDNKDVDYILSLMSSEKNDFNIYSKQQDIDSASVFQEGIYNTMIKCRRIVTFLSPKFLQSPECLEKFNLGMVCNRSYKKNMLVPFLIDNVSAMPTYMQMMQYIDCRYKDGEERKKKMLSGLNAFVASFRIDVRYSTLKPMVEHYDVFISYCHKNTVIAQTFLTQLLKLEPDLNIFFDRIELKAGSSWQQTLYNSMDNTTVVLALLTPDYMASVVCQEEYNLALAKHLSQAHELELVPVLVDQMSQIPTSHGRVPILDATCRLSAVTKRVCRAVVSLINSSTRDEHVFNQVDSPVDLDGILSLSRARWFRNTYNIIKNEIRHKTVELKCKQPPVALHSLTISELLSLERHRPSTAPRSEKSEEEQIKEAEAFAEKRKHEMKNETLRESYDVGFICADYKYALFLDMYLRSRDPNIVTNFDVKTAQNQLESLDRSKIVVAFLSPSLVHASQETDEFNVALARHRAGKGRTILYPIHLMALPKWPTYFRLVPCRIALDDLFWKQMMTTAGYTNKQAVEKICCEASEIERELLEGGHNLPPGAILALTSAGDDIISLLQTDREDGSRNTCIHNIVKLDIESSETKDAAETSIPIAQHLKTLHLDKDDSDLDEEESQTETSTVDMGGTTADASQAEEQGLATNKSSSAQPGHPRKEESESSGSPTHESAATEPPLSKRSSQSCSII